MRLFKRVRGLDNMPATITKLHAKNRNNRKRFAVLKVSAGVLSGATTVRRDRKSWLLRLVVEAFVKCILGV